MATNVFANGKEICSKTASGTSSMAVDVCFSPGAPMPGVPVPYMNQCKASDLTNGSRTVFINGGQVCLEDKSYFATSYGNEPATQGLKKGAVSGSVQGKCRFVSWSPNVFIEGAAVTRHLDLVTHNHNSPSNTPPTPYISKADIGGACKKDHERIEKRCKPNDTNRHRGKGAPKGKDTSKAGGWVLDHCGPLLVKPGLENFNEWRSEFGNLDKLMGQAAQQLKNGVIGKLETEILEFAGKKIAKMAVRRGLTGWIPVVGWVMTAVDVAVTGYEVATTVGTMKDEVADLKRIVDELKTQGDKITQSFEKYKDPLKNFGKLGEEEQKKIAREVMTDVQSAYGAANPCMRARKCALVPFNKTDGTADTWSGKGCCPGQTGHHLMPDAMFRSTDPAAKARAFSDWKAGYGGKIPKNELKEADMPRDKKPKAKCWDGYSEGAGPTICLEGTDNTSGSHGVVHGLTEKLIGKHRAGPTMKYTTARRELAGTVSKLYGCDHKCLEAQLDEAYCKMYSCGNPGEPCDKKLKDADVVPHSGMSGGGPAEGGGKKKD
jgi:hypothetical protein